MKTLGIIGGIGPESTIEYYRLIIAAYRERTRNGSYPPILINSINLTRMLDLIGAGDLGGVTDYLLSEIRRLANAGADVGLLAANTPHIVFDDLRRQPYSLAQGLILGGTELPLLFRDSAGGRVPFLDTTRIHAEQAVAHILA